MTVAMQKLSNKLSDEYYKLVPTLEEKIIAYFNANYNEKEFKDLLNKIDFKVETKDETELIEALNDAIENGNVALVKKLIKKVSSLNQGDRWNKVPIIRTANANGNRVEIAKILVDAGADVNFVYKDEVAIYSALEKDNKDGYIEALLELGANPNWENELGMTPLFIASQATGGVEALILGGANVNHVESRGSSVLDWYIGRYSSWYGNKYAHEYQPTIKKNIDFLIKAGATFYSKEAASISKKDNSLSRTMLCNAVGDDKFLDYLCSFEDVKNTPDFNPDYKGWSAVFEASYKGSLASLKILIKKGAVLNSYVSRAYYSQNAFAGASVLDVAKNKKVRDLLIANGVKKGIRISYTVIMETRGDWESIQPILKKYLKKDKDELEAIWNTIPKEKGEFFEKVITRKKNPDDIWDSDDYEYVVLNSIVVAEISDLEEAELIKAAIEKGNATVMIV